MKLHRPAPDADPLGDHSRGPFAAARRDLAAALIERDAEIDLVLTALLAREHVLLVGPPGCAKSLLLDAVMGWLGGKSFTCLLTRFTTPEELFGPISVAGLKEDKYRRITAGKLPEADGCFLDEVFKGSSAILNTLLRLLNERVFDPGDGIPVKCPLRLCVAAANEWPGQSETGAELNALFDRFLLRKAVRPIATAAGRKRLLWAADHTPRMTAPVTLTDLDRAHQEAMGLAWSSDAVEAFEAILKDLAKEGVQPGDRRQFKTVAACRAFAYLCGGDRVEPEHLEVAAHTLWDSPEEQPRKAAEVVARIANPTGMKVNQLLLECEQVVGGCDVRNLASAASAAAKLGEIDRQLAGLKPDGRVEKARTHVRDQVKRLKLASLEAV
jgi:MoxR-like ATPase